MTKNNAEYERFDSAVDKILSISHDELQKREEKWKKDRSNQKKRRPKKR